MAYFNNINKINYEGATSTNPFAFKFYNPEEKVAGKTVEEPLRFGAAYWHTFTLDGSDRFGAARMGRRWDEYRGRGLAKARVDGGFEFFARWSVPFCCF